MSQSNWITHSDTAKIYVARDTDKNCYFLRLKQEKQDQVVVNRCDSQFASFSQHPKASKSTQKHPKVPKVPQKHPKVPTHTHTNILRDTYRYTDIHLQKTDDIHYLNVCLI